MKGTLKAARIVTPEVKAAKIVTEVKAARGDTAVAMMTTREGSITRQKGGALEAVDPWRVTNNGRKTIVITVTAAEAIEVKEVKASDLVTLAVSKIRIVSRTGDGTGTIEVGLIMEATEMNQPI